MPRPEIALLLAASAALVSGCAQQPPGAVAGAGAAASGRQCFHADEVNGFSAPSDEIVNVTVGANRHFQFRLAGACPDVNWSNRIALRTTGGSSWICQGLDAELLVPSPIGPQRCLVTDVRPISEEEWRARRQ